MGELLPGASHSDASTGRSLRLVTMGTGEFALPTFRLLSDRGYHVVGLVTQPDRPTGRSREIRPGPVKQLALERGIEVFQPESVNVPEGIDWLRGRSPDVLVVAAFGQILSPAVLEVPRLGGINLHASLLPKYRGAAPVAWAIYHGESETGVTVIRMLPRVDAGSILAQARTSVFPDETAGELEDRLAALGAPLVCETIEQLQAGTAKEVAQDPKLVSRAPKLKKEDGLIDWNRPARQVFNQVRAMQPWPTAYSFWHRREAATAARSEPARFTLWRVRPLESGERPAGQPQAVSTGTIFGTEHGRLLVQVRDALVEVEELQPAGKDRMTAAAFLRGSRVKTGDRFGTKRLPEAQSGD